MNIPGLISYVGVLYECTIILLSGYKPEQADTSRGNWNPLLLFKGRRGNKIFFNAMHCGVSLSERFKSVVGFLQLLKTVLFL